MGTVCIGHGHWAIGPVPLAHLRAAPAEHAHGGRPAAGADRGAHGVVNYVAYSPNLMKPLHTHFSLDAYRVNKYSDRADPHFPGLPDCLPLAPV